MSPVDTHVDVARPGALSRHLPVDILNILVGMSNQLMEDLTIFYAKATHVCVDLTCPAKQFMECVESVHGT